MTNLYQTNKSKAELNIQLLIGLIKHLQLAQTTSETKQNRVQSLNNVGEVLEYIVVNLNEAIPEDEQSIYSRFFNQLLVKVKKAQAMIHTRPLHFNEEIGFMSVLMKI